MTISLVPNMSQYARQIILLFPPPIPNFQSLIKTNMLLQQNNLLRIGMNNQLLEMNNQDILSYSGCTGYFVMTVFLMIDDRRAYT